MADESIDDLTAPERLALLLPLALALWGWAVLTLFYAGLPVSRGTALLTLALGGAAAWRLGLLRWLGRWDRATMQRAWPLAALVLLWAAVLALRPPDHWLIQYDGAAHLLQARALTDGNYLPPESGFDAYHKYAFYRPPLLPEHLLLQQPRLPSLLPPRVDEEDARRVRPQPVLQRWRRRIQRGRGDQRQARQLGQGDLS